MTPIGSAIRMNVGSPPIMENDDFTRRCKLVVMLVIGLKAANYIKLESHGYVLGYKVSFRDQFYPNSMFLVDVEIEQSRARSMGASDRVGLRTLQLCAHTVPCFWNSRDRKLQLAFLKVTDSYFSRLSIVYEAAT